MSTFGRIDEQVEVGVELEDVIFDDLRGVVVPSSSG
jgi:hypothetical protein